MSFKPFYVHRYLAPGKLPNRNPRAFTAKISEHAFKPDMVIMQATFCSPKDQFCKKLGREYAARAEIVEVKKRDIPRWLAALAEVCAFNRGRTPEEWYYVYKYVV